MMTTVKFLTLILAVCLLFWGGRAAAQVKKYSAQVQQQFNDIMGAVKPEPVPAPAVKRPPPSPLPEAGKTSRSRRRTFFIPRQFIEMLANRIDRKSKTLKPAPATKESSPYSSQLRSVLEKLIFSNKR